MTLKILFKFLKEGLIKMLTGIRFYPKRGLNNLWGAIEKNIRTFYSQKFTPLYVVQEAGKDYLGIVFEINNLTEFENFLTSNPTIRHTTRKTRSIPLHLPYYYDLPKGHPDGLHRFNIFLRIDPEHYKKIYEKIPKLKLPKGIFLSFSSFSFGDDDVILSLLAEDIGNVRKFIAKNIDTIDGVKSSSVSRVVRSQLLTSRQKWDNHRRMLLYSNKEENAPRRKYEKELSTMTVIMRAYAKEEPIKLWNSITEHIDKFESQDFIPLYSSHQDINDYVSLIAEIRNFETINQLFFKGLPHVIKARKWRAYPLLKPMYFLIPKNAPEHLERYLISLRVEPALYVDVYDRFVSMDYPENVFLSYISYSLGNEDILVSLLVQNRDDMERFVEICMTNVDGITSYKTSSLLRTLRLTSKKVWFSHRNKHLSSYDRAHLNEYKKAWDWTEWEDYLEEKGGPLLGEFYNRE
jgi:DNA-binding Lrp family transcriptional regulator